MKKDSSYIVLYYLIFNYLKHIFVLPCIPIPTPGIFSSLAMDGGSTMADIMTVARERERGRERERR
jgi:hypothetical protein